MLHTPRVCAAAFAIQNAMRMRRIIISSVVCLALQNFLTLSHRGQDFREKVIEHKMCFLIFSTNLSETFCIVRRIQGHTIHVHMSSCTVPVIIVRF